MEPILLNELPVQIIDFVGEIKEITFPRQGYTSNVGILLGINGDKYVVKRAKGQQFCSWLKQEAYVLERIKNTSLPVPRLLQFIEGQDESWTLTEYMEGQTLRSYLLNEEREVQRNEVIFQFGKILKEIHSTSCPSELVGEGMWIERMIEVAEYNFLNYKTDGSAELLEMLKDEKPAPVEQTFIHGDFTIDNVLVKDGRISAVIDWSGGAFGDPRYDAALAIRPKQNAFENESDRVVFFEGYGQRIVSDAEYLYFENGLYNFF